MKFAFFYGFVLVSLFVFQVLLYWSPPWMFLKLSIACYKIKSLRRKKFITRTNRSLQWEDVYFGYKEARALYSPVSEQNIFHFVINVITQNLFITINFIKSTYLNHHVASPVRTGSRVDKKNVLLYLPGFRCLSRRGHFSLLWCNNCMTYTANEPSISGCKTENH